MSVSPIFPTTFKLNDDGEVAESGQPTNWSISDITIVNSGVGSTTATNLRYLGELDVVEPAADYVATDIDEAQGSTPEYVEQAELNVTEKHHAGTTLRQAFTAAIIGATAGALIAFAFHKHRNVQD